MSARLNVDDVRAELRLEDVARRYLPDARTDKPKARISECPRCHHTSSSDAIVLNFRKQTWGHFGNGKREGGDCYGDALDLIAACEGLDRHRDFAKVLTIAADIAGIQAKEMTDHERERLRQEREQRNAERAARQAAEEERELAEAKVKAALTWSAMPRGRRDAAGMTYLRRRGLDAGALIEGDYVRFDAYGNVCVALYSFDGELVNVMRRKRGDGEPKCWSLDGCPTAGSLIGRIQEIAAGTNTIITEGITDALTAIVRWPGRLVLGAQGAGNLPALVAAAAPRVRETGGKLVLVPDGDDIGQRQMIRAGEHALAAGLVMDSTLLVVDVAPHHDLNEAHCKGWKP